MCMYVGRRKATHTLIWSAGAPVETPSTSPGPAEQRAANFQPRMVGLPPKGASRMERLPAIATSSQAGPPHQARPHPTVGGRGRIILRPVAALYRPKRPHQVLMPRVGPAPLGHLPMPPPRDPPKEARCAVGGQAVPTAQFHGVYSEGGTGIAGLPHLANPQPTERQLGGRSRTRPRGGPWRLPAAAGKL